MPEEFVSTLRRNLSFSGASSIDLHDQAEQGFHFGLTHFSSAGQPLETRKTLSLRCSLRSSDSTLVGVPGVAGGSQELNDHGVLKPLPHQGKHYSSLRSIIL
jgi:hypothetical protein